MTGLPDRIKVGLELEPQIAAMAPAEPDMVRLLEALRFLENSLGENLAIVVDMKQEGEGGAYLRRTFKNGRMETSWNVGIEGENYVNHCITGTDSYQELYPSFVSAVFRFAGRPQPSVAAAAFAKRASDKSP